VYVTVKAYRDCTQDATWWRNPQNRTWSNYTACVNIAELSVSEFTSVQSLIARVSADLHFKSSGFITNLRSAR